MISIFALIITNYMTNKWTKPSAWSLTKKNIMRLLAKVDLLKTNKPNSLSKKSLRDEWCKLMHARKGEATICWVGSIDPTEIKYINKSFL
jgi:hypothetical protein